VTKNKLSFLPVAVLVLHSLRTALLCERRSQGLDNILRQSHSRQPAVS